MSRWPALAEHKWPTLSECHRYGTDKGGITPAVYRNDLVRAEIYPDSDDTTGLGDGTDGVYDRIELKYNRQGQRIELKDQLASVHTYELDKLGGNDP